MKVHLRSDASPTFLVLWLLRAGTCGAYPLRRGVCTVTADRERVDQVVLFCLTCNIRQFFGECKCDRNRAFLVVYMLCPSHAP